MSRVPEHGTWSSSKGPQGAQEEHKTAMMEQLPWRWIRCKPTKVEESTKETKARTKGKASMAGLDGPAGEPTKEQRPSPREERMEEARKAKEERKARAARKERKEKEEEEKERAEDQELQGTAVDFVVARVIGGMSAPISM